MTTSKAFGNQNNGKRGTQTAAPHGYETVFTEDQHHRMDAHQRFGWELHVIRRPLVSTPIVVIVDINNNKTREVVASGELSPFVDLRTA